MIHGSGPDKASKAAHCECHCQVSVKNWAHHDEDADDPERRQRNCLLLEDCGSDDSEVDDSWKTNRHRKP